MAIGESRLHTMFRKSRIMFESIAWLEAFTPTNKRLILDLIREDQLRSKGIDGDGDIIGFYSFATEVASGGKKQQGDPYSLFDTGRFYQSMFIRVMSDRFTVNADGQKDDDNLFDKYGDEIIQFTDENLDKIKAIIRKSYLDYIRRVLFSS